MRLPSALVFSSLAFVFATAVAQSDKPGPMQSGAHAQPQANAPATDNAVGAAQPAAPAGEFDVQKLFATTCGWCHLNGGRVAGKGPQLMGTSKTDAEIVSRIRNGMPGQMPAFGAQFTDDQLKAIVAYIRGLKAS
jgi:mono/diheme cytochrome c family protein